MTLEEVKEWRHSAWKLSPHIKDKIDWLIAEVERLQETRGVDEAFYNYTVKQPNAAWAALDRIGRESTSYGKKPSGNI